MSSLHVKVLGQGTPAIIVHGSGSSCEEHAAQEPLAAHHRLVMPERRGYPRSPPAARVDYEVDAQDITDLLSDDAHLVGKSYGGVGCLLAASLRPEAVLSLTVVEPPLLGLARGNPDAEAVAGRLTSVYETMQNASPEAFDAAFDGALGFQHPPAALDPAVREAVISMMKERLPFDAKVSYDDLAAASFPKLVISGGWSGVFTQVSEELSRRIHAEHVVIRGNGHSVGGTGKPFNDALEGLWDIAEKRSR
ncbi:MAG TPA: alpha/beta hydrolase [Thermoplasmata archaeon]|nr:alpha/beta hydrolase [Thermoplasmata archaeon]